METIVRRIDLTRARGLEAQELLRREWLVTNGIGGYASGTISGSVSWRYHGLLIASLPEPFGRMVMLNHLGESIRLADGRCLELSGHDQQPLVLKRGPVISEFRLENHLPVWTYESDGIVIEKHVLFLYGQNTVHIGYRLVSGQQSVLLELRPSIHFRGHEHSVNEALQDDYRWSASGDRYEVTRGEILPRLRLVLKGDHAVFTYDGGNRREIGYPKEAERGYPSRGLLWSPGFFSVQLPPRRDATLIASTEWWNTMLA